MKSQIKKKNSGIVELLIPTLNKIVRNQELCSTVSIVNFEQVMPAEILNLLSITQVKLSSS